MTADRTQPDRDQPRRAGDQPRRGGDQPRREGLAESSLATSRRPAGHAPGQPAEPPHPAGTPQGEPVADEQIPRD
ncbi:hypothetical protein M446_0407 [Methylobacterium sp. 4-46]|uniref:hypothetical protein n=1 Tax=unclassified Methylobacterium TaxID=2615210 RepID=UPI000165C767|nr:MULTISPECIES: hypothetical protein [Methylobacterium]ACA14976.1 hypothetical protein M446_0407 [Methylobacterium sp. 4-46]WFT80713.1 hypothetical protein QA634_02060 [Methylobacterium nodulans]